MSVMLRLLKINHSSLWEIAGVFTDKEIGPDIVANIQRDASVAGGRATILPQAGRL